MSKKPVKKSVKYDGPMTNGMKFFLAGCVAQLYLLIVNRCYVEGTIDQMLAWNGYLKILAVLGAVAPLGGAAALKKGNAKDRELYWYLAGGGAFLAAASALVWWNMGALSLLTTVVPAVLVIDVLWWLFDRESALSLTVLAVAMLMAWMNRRADAMAVKALSAAAAAGVAGLEVAFVRSKDKKVNPMLLVSCLIAIFSIVAAMVSGALAYYVMWALAAVIFCMAVYYTVKQL